MTTDVLNKSFVSSMNISLKNIIDIASISESTKKANKIKEKNKKLLI